MYARHKFLRGVSGQVLGNNDHNLLSFNICREHSSETPQYHSIPQQHEFYHYLRTQHQNKEPVNNGHNPLSVLIQTYLNCLLAVQKPLEINGEITNNDHMSQTKVCFIIPFAQIFPSNNHEKAIQSKNQANKPTQTAAELPRRRSITLIH